MSACTLEPTIRLLIITWFVRHISGGKEIELCGRFRDWDHFHIVKELELSRGWRVTRAWAEA